MRFAISLIRFMCAVVLGGITALIAWVPVYIVFIFKPCFVWDPGPGYKPSSYCASNITYIFGWILIVALIVLFTYLTIRFWKALLPRKKGQAS